MFSTVVSDVCPDTSKVNFTIKCNFEDCYIPGEYCDRSDSDFYRCAKCDEDVCNGGNVPGECKIPCLGEYVIKKRGGGIPHCRTVPKSNRKITERGKIDTHKKKHKNMPAHFSYLVQVFQ